MHEDEYTLIEDVVAPPSDRGGHLIDYETGKLLSNLWSTYLAKIREGLTPTVMPVMRRTTNDLLSEAFVGQELQRGIKVVSRTRRGCTFQAALWSKETGQMVHTSEIVTVWVDTKAGGAAEIPEDQWSKVEELEGREIPVTPRTP